MDEPTVAVDLLVMDWDIVDLGVLAYAPALEVQREKNRAVSRGDAKPTLLLVEHEPVITISHRRSARDHLLASETRLAELGIDVQDTDRGGDITYHGPGQLVAYPILRLNDYGLNLGRYMRLLEEAVVATLSSFGVAGQTEAGATGVWVELGSGQSGVGNGGDAACSEGQPSTAPAPLATAKICAMGVRIRKNTTMHGLALNVTTDLLHFATIDPCGLGNRPVTSLAERLGGRCPSMSAVKAELTQQLAVALDRSVSEGVTRA